MSGLYLDQVLDHLYESFRDVIPYDRVGCALLSDAGTELVSRWARSDGQDPLLKAGYSALMAGSSLQTIFDTGEPRVINDLAAYGEGASHVQVDSTCGRRGMCSA